MITVVLTSCPQRLRGHLTRWLLELDAGVYVGRVSARIRDHLWELICGEIGRGRAVMTYPTPSTEQGFAVRSFNGLWEPCDYEGLTLVRRPTDTQQSRQRSQWAKESKSQGLKTWKPK
ncbi:type I-E CRISPR-associated endoribonuclease Cas2e [Corynebacterium heidelbergense]|uniref:Type I-E CRISPR-associated endoribonuclease Cas2 n=1 Tax=Corynebacterium heidelbergense TaxID=2055947 RepID=A0A364V507_9CORY|nr:type I-E CRISPR-associated endoribonuclease Cas2e [Corynebacterium heidelbergense]RAV31707.1 type I-E CRISPR-associated endoribonuclease Cas2 [Corynebacterium heidelbergense]